MNKHQSRLVMMVFGALLFLSGGAWGTPGAQDAALQELLRNRLEGMRATGSAQIDGVAIAAVDFIPELYEKRQFRPAWTNRANVDVVLKAINASAEQGLSPRDFHAEQIARARQRLAEKGMSDLDARADFELIMSDAFVRLAYQMLYGKVDPEALDSNWNYGGPLLDQDPATVINQHLDAGTLGELIPRLEPEDPYYERMKAALKRYREIEASGGWASIPDGPKLEAGMQDERVGALRRRLQITGDLGKGADGNSTRFDDQLADAVKRFQERHGLDADGVVGPGTLATLNVPVADRIGQIRVNLERARWVLHNLEPYYVIVNIAGFRVYVMKDGKEIWTTRAMVGRPFRKTPVFKGEMKYVVFNPTWTVPPGILRKDILPKLRKDPSYLAQKNFSLVDRDGKRVDPSTVDWSASRFPFQIVQPPGPTNALGEIKFMFPNKHLVYLHDTPSKALFEKTTRTFSSGCIRVDRPFELAEVVFGADQGWTQERVQTIRESGKTQTVSLSNPVPVLLLYWTVEPGPDGRVRFMSDVYNRDKRLLKELDEAFKTRI
jgi:murein L,D-transpeptidase YcbB/YkuD